VRRPRAQQRDPFAEPDFNVRIRRYNGIRDFSGKKQARVNIQRNILHCNNLPKSQQLQFVAARCVRTLSGTL